MANHADKIALVRGMSMGAVAHNTARRHVLTGYLPAGTSVRRSSVTTSLSFLCCVKMSPFQIGCGCGKF